ncbi:MAG: OmpH family outer membrane protein [Rikenellaceae bacterium]
MKITKTLSVAILGLVSMAFATSCGGANTSTKNSVDTSAVSTVSSSNGKIAYVRMDSLMSGYGLYIDLGGEFAKKQQQAQKELESKARSLESEARDFQEKAQKGLITSYQAQKKQEELANKEQQIRTYQDTKLRELSEQEGVLTAQIAEAIMSYLKEYNAEKGYSMILQSMGGNPVILADPALDITAEVLDELNRRYEATLTK